MLAIHAAEGAHQRHVGDDINHFAVDRGSLVGEAMMERRASGSQAKERHHQMAATAATAAAIGRLTVPRNTIAPSVATQGGSTFHMNMFSTVKMALEVAVIRLARVPGSRSAK